MQNRILYKIEGEFVVKSLNGDKAIIDEVWRYIQSHGDLHDYGEHGAVRWAYLECRRSHYFRWRRRDGYIASPAIAPNETEAIDTLDDLWDMPYSGAKDKWMFVEIPIAPWWMKFILFFIRGARLDHAEDAGYIIVKRWMGKFYVTEVNGGD